MKTTMYGKFEQAMRPYARPAGLAFALTSCFTFCLFWVALANVNAVGHAQTTVAPAPATVAVDPGVRTDSADAGGELANLTSMEDLAFRDGMNRFLQTYSVTGNVQGEPGRGLGPTFNSNSCASCHSQPTIGGSSPPVNPQVAVATDNGASNKLPSFVTANGPVVEARFPYLMNSNGTVSKTPDGGVHALFTIAGRADAPGCTLAQANFAQMLSVSNLILRIPTPTFGAGLIENIADSTIYANMKANALLKLAYGISGHPNVTGNDGTVTRFGWKAQNKSMEIFTGEAYNVEMGITNELFPNERALPPSSCLFTATPEDSINFPASNAETPGSPTAILSDSAAFSIFMRFLAPPQPSSVGIPGSPTAQSVANGQTLFTQVHCNLCHTPSLQTASSDVAPALSNQPVGLYSDLLVHHMGTGLADNVTQGAAGPDEFRTAPLWGLGQRLFFLHDGRATPLNGGLVAAIAAHNSKGSEAVSVVKGFQKLTVAQQQDLLNFLRSL